MAATLATPTVGTVANPTPPDFFHCNSVYGAGIRSDDCIKAAAMLPEGEHMFTFVSLPNGGVGFPMYRSIGTCYLVAELAGPDLPGIMRIIPNIIRALASIVIAQCVIIRRGIGGFATYGLSELVDYVNDRRTSENHDPDSFFRTATSTAFLTLTVHSGPLDRLPSPGNTDPSIPLKVSGELEKQATKAQPGSDLRKFLSLDAAIWSGAAAGLTAGSSTTWWRVLSLVPITDQMAYECDSFLGSPSIVDCSNIKWNQLVPASLAPPSDTVAVGPGLTKFFHSNSCYLAVSATISIVLNWAQIRAALAVLMNMCIDNPSLSSPQGGRAYYSIPAKVSRRGKRQTEANGLNALPPNVNVTIFQQLEAWTSPAKESKSCAWEAASNRKPLSKCANV